MPRVDLALAAPAFSFSASSLIDDAPAQPAPAHNAVLRKPAAQIFNAVWQACVVFLCGSSVRGGKGEVT